MANCKKIVYGKTILDVVIRVGKMDARELFEKSKYKTQ
jgi:hypothetical protein